MKAFAIRCTVVTVFLCAVAAAALGAVPRILTIQGKLTDSLGQPVPDGVQSVTFRLYNVETCGQGTALWQEVQNVQTSGGIFNVNLGAVTPITLPFDKQYWLGMQPPSCGELCTRTRLTTAPYAVRAEIAETVADGAITAGKIADAAVSEASIANGAVSSSKLAPEGWTSYAPQWSSTGSPQPAIGNGVLTGKYFRLGNVVFCHIALNAGSTTSFGSGEWAFSLPFPATTYFVGAANGVCGSVRVTGVAVAHGPVPPLQIVGAVSHGSTTGYWSAQNPSTWNNASYFSFDITYERP